MAGTYADAHTLYMHMHLLNVIENSLPLQGVLHAGMRTR